MIFQDPYASLNPRWIVEDIVGEPLREHAIETDPEALHARVDELLLSVGLSPQDRLKYPHQFSGGQRQRISIARALATEPEFLVCDEPTSALDVSVQAQVLNIMKDLQRERGLTYLFISHNLAVVRHVSDQVGVMYLGRLVELADKHTLFDSPRHPYTRMLLDAIPKMHDTGRARTPVSGEVPNPLNPPTAARSTRAARTSTTVAATSGRCCWVWRDTCGLSRGGRRPDLTGHFPQMGECQPAKFSLICCWALEGKVWPDVGQLRARSTQGEQHDQTLLVDGLGLTVTQCVGAGGWCSQASGPSR